MSVSEAVEVVGTSFDTALRRVEDEIRDIRRNLATTLLLSYPDDELLAQRARRLREYLGADSVEINAVTGQRQVTLVSAPAPALGRKEIACEDSLCVLTAGTNEVLHIKDTSTDPLTAGHPAAHHWGAWAAAPLLVRDNAAGSVCALTRTARAWTTRDESLLVQAAGEIGRAVDAWLDTVVRPLAT